MGFFTRSTKQQIKDPVFGNLTLGRHGWEGGQIVLGDHLHMVSVLVERADEPPQERDRSTIKAFLSHYDQLVPAIRTALFELWQPFLETAQQESIWPTSSHALWHMLQLETLTVRLSGTVELTYAFAGDVWPDAMLSVHVNDMAVIPGSLDD